MIDFDTIKMRSNNIVDDNKYSEINKTEKEEAKSNLLKLAFSKSKLVKKKVLEFYLSSLCRHLLFVTRPVYELLNQSMVTQL